MEVSPGVGLSDLQLNGFVRHFADFRDQFVVIGGCACHELFADEALPFRVTRDIDFVLIVLSLTDEFYKAFWEYVVAGEYDIYREKPKDESRPGRQYLYRFLNAKSSAYPEQLEMLTGIRDLPHPEGRVIRHFDPDGGASGLSAIIMDADYYDLIQSHRTASEKGLPTVTADVLLLLKMKAYLNLLKEKQAGRIVRSKDLLKHRNDVYHLATLLDGTFSTALPDAVLADLRSFLSLFASEEKRTEWEGILAHLTAYDIPAVAANQKALTSSIVSYFGV